MNDQLKVRHRFNASAERVFDAFVDVKKASQFLFATPTGTMIRAELEPKVGGKLLFIERRDGKDFEHVGQILELDRPSRFAFEFKVPVVSPLTTRVRIDIARVGAGCELTLTHEGLPPEAANRSAEGWEKILTVLERLLGVASGGEQAEADGAG
jgi:uncharacterized protein YndB with AHSA1/START domain